MEDTLYNPYNDTIETIKSKDTWTWTEYFAYKEKLESNNIQVILVDMIGQPVEGSIRASDELFSERNYPDGTIFVLYCNSGCSISGYTKNKLEPIFSQYRFVDLVSGAGMYSIEKMNQQFFKSSQ